MGIFEIALSFWLLFKGLKRLEQCSRIDAIPRHTDSGGSIPHSPNTIEIRVRDVDFRDPMFPEDFRRHAKKLF